MKHFLSVSLMWKYSPVTAEQQKSKQMKIFGYPILTQMPSKLCHINRGFLRFQACANDAKSYELLGIPGRVSYFRIVFSQNRGFCSTRLSVSFSDLVSFETVYFSTSFCEYNASYQTTMNLRCPLIRVRLAMIMNYT